MSDYEIAHLDSIHVTATSTTALTDANKIDALTEFSPKASFKLHEHVHLNTDGESRWSRVWTTRDVTLSGECKPNSATQAVINTAVATGASFFVHCITNASATVGQVKGQRYELVAESSEAPRAAGELVTFSVPCKINGAPVAILAT